MMQEQHCHDVIISYMIDPSAMETTTINAWRDKTRDAHLQCLQGCGTVASTVIIPTIIISNTIIVIAIIIDV